MNTAILWILISILMDQCVSYVIFGQERRQNLQCNMLVESVEKKSTNKVFIFGLGYVGSLVASQLKLQGFDVVGTCTNVNKALQLREQGIQTYLFDEISLKRGQMEATNDILTSNYILSTIPPYDDKNSVRDLVIEAHADDLRRAALSANGLRWIGYLSSTGVYGDCDGEWVDERRKIMLQEENDKIMARIKCEQRWKQLQEKTGLPVHIFRLGGIYGPERNAIDTLIDLLQESKTLPPTDDVTFISRIHVEDIVQILITSMQLPTPGEIYNVADDLPSTRYDVLSYACRLAGIKGLQPGRVKAARGGSKRIDNSKVRSLLAKKNRELIYPDYRIGLNTLWKNHPQRNFLLNDQRSNMNSNKQAQSSNILGYSDDSGGSLAKDGVKEDTIRTVEDWKQLISRIDRIESRMTQIENAQSSIMGILNQLSRAVKLEDSSSKQTP